MTNDDIHVEVDPIGAATEEKVDGAALLDELRVVVTKYVVLPSDHAITAVVLWIVATHAVTAFEHATRLAIHSPVKRCGKSRLLEVIEALSHSPMATTNISIAALFRMIDSGGDQPPTLILDEADRLFGSSKKDEDNRDLIALLNNGFRRGSPTWRCVGPQQVPTPFSNYAMAAVAGIGRLPDTIEDRAINLTMRRRMPGEVVAKFRLRTDLPVLHDLRDRIAVWAGQRIDRIAEPVEDLPDELEDRAADAWEPLLAIADVAGGDWPKLGREAAESIATEAADADGQLTEEVRLLKDIRDAFDAMPHVSFLATNVLLTELRKVDDAPWGEFDFSPHKLARRLGNFDVRPRHNDAKTQRGYHLNDLRDAFRRYLVSKPSEPSGTTSDQQKRPDGLKSPDGSKCPDVFAPDGSKCPDDSKRPDETAGQNGSGRFGTLRTDTPPGMSTCSVCGEPLDPAVANIGRHVNCGPQRNT
ncbi:DUF3631 domain-containing protein [Actinopolymorpha sp. B11F2]|uniref:DUF3631 domain-containing protein n=1 Tax=Actinopolymorpha sp. B11F2 TaxID=3160862 RepID=UPI0032E4A2FD